MAERDVLGPEEGVGESQAVEPDQEERRQIHKCGAAYPKHWAVNLQGHWEPGGTDPW